MRNPKVARLIRPARLAGVCLALVLSAANTAQARDAAAPEKAATPPRLLPDRLLTCSIGHVTNFDPSREQTPEQLRYDGFHVFSLFLPAIPALAGRPPDPTEDAPPVDPRTRIVADPDHISGQPSDRFGRIIDMWPERVETSTPIGASLLNAIVINPIDAAHGTASLFMLRASELTHFEPDHIYQGTCHIAVGEPARKAAMPTP